MTATADHREHAFTGARGRRLHGWTQSPAGPVRGHVIVVHGIGEHSGRYEPFARALIGAGWVVHGYDHRGHGRSSGQRGHVDRWSDYLDDLGARLALIDGAGPRVLLAHSMGGLIALDYLLQRPEGIAGAVVSAAPLDPAGVAGPIRVALARVLTRLLPRLPIPAGVPAERLSRDPDAVRACRNDPLCHSRVTPRWGAEILDAIARVDARAADIARPVLMVHGDDDCIARSEGTRRFFDRMQHPGKMLHIYPGVRHEPHHDLGCERVIGDVVGWIEARGENP